MSKAAGSPLTDPAQGEHHVENLFRVVSAAEFDAAVASGAVPRCPSDTRSNRVHLNFRDDVEKVAGLYFTASEAPVALEIGECYIRGQLQVLLPTLKKPFRQVTLDQPGILLSWIVSVHRLEWVDNAGIPAFRLADRDAVDHRSDPSNQVPETR